MKPRLQIAFLALLTASGAGCTSKGASFFSGGDQKSAHTYNQQGAIPEDVKSLDVDNGFGAVRIVGADSATGDWTWKLTVRAATDAAAQQFAAQTTCKAERNGSRLTVRVTFPESSRNVSFQSDLDLHVPEGIAVTSQNRFGPTDISGFASDVQATGQNGPVTIRKVTGKVQAQTAFAPLTVSETGAATLKNQNGPATATQIQGPLVAETSFSSLTVSKVGGPARLRNQNGPVNASEIGGDADIRTSFDRLKLKGAEGSAVLANQNGPIESREVAGSVTATTAFASLDIEAAGPSLVCRNQNGAVRLRPTSNLYTNLEVSTSFANVSVRLPAEPKPAIQARTSFGEVESDFPVLMKPRGQDPFADALPGTPRVKLANQNGSIAIKRD